MFLLLTTACFFLISGTTAFVVNPRAIDAAGDDTHLTSYAPHENCLAHLIPSNFQEITNCHCFCGNSQQHAFVVKAKRILLQKNDAIMPSMLVSPLNNSELIVLSQPGHSSMRTVSFQSVSAADYTTTDGKTSTGIVGSFSLSRQCLDFRLFHFNSTFSLINFQKSVWVWMAKSQFIFDFTNRSFSSVRKSETSIRLARQAREEKNWGPFSFTSSKLTDKYYTNSDMPMDQLQLLFEYSINPHRILIQIPAVPGSLLNTKMLACTKLTSRNTMFWNPAHMRSGTPAVFIQEYNVYLSFFHVSARFTNNSVLKTYVMGAHTFDAEPPFALRHVSPEPIVAENFFVGAYAYRRLNYQIYPSQFLVRDDKVILSMHRNDRESWVVEMNMRGLMDSLQPVDTEECSSEKEREPNKNPPPPIIKRQKRGH